LGHVSAASVSAAGCAMTVMNVPKKALLRLLEVQPANRVPARCMAAVLADQRESFQTGTTSARSLRKSLELKLASARRAGKPIEGGDELLLRLQELDEASIQVFGFEGAHDVVTIYASIAHQVLAGCLVIERASQ
jgi:hypothetical protein